MSEAQPLYARVKEHILDNIRSGAWEAGRRVPSENELVESFGISRMTANRALRELQADGLVQRVQGVGTFAAPLHRVSATVRAMPSQKASTASASPSVAAAGMAASQTRRT